MLETVKIFTIALFSVCCLAFTSTIPIEEARSFFPKLDQGEKYVDSLIKLASKHQSSAEMLAYLGAAQTAKASYLFNPYSKYTSAKKGLTIMNNSVSKATTNLEVRFIRYSVELNIPSVMPFTDHTVSDKKFIIDNLDKKHSFYPAIKVFMLKYGKLTESEKRKFS
jgi:hypothetical protein